jgi:hypothetical protein
MKFVKLNGWLSENSGFISIEIKNGDRNNCIGDQVWISEDGAEMQVYYYSDSDVLEETMDNFEVNSKRAFKGALLRMGVNF